MKKLSDRFRSGIPFHVLLTVFTVGLTLCSILIIGFTFYSSASNFLEEHADTLIKKQFSQSVTSLNEKLAVLESSAQITTNDKALLQELSVCHANGQLHTASFERLSELTQREFLKSNSIVPEIETLLIITDSGTISSKNTLLTDVTQSSFSSHFGLSLSQPSFYFPEIAGTAGQFNYWTNTLPYYEQFILYTHPIIAANRTIGTLCYAISPEVFDNCLDSQISSAVCFGNDRIVYNTTAMDLETVQGIFAATSTEERPNMLILPQYNLHILHDAVSTLEAPLRSLRRISLLMGLLVVAVSIVTTLFFSRSLTRPLIKLQEAMGQINSKPSLRNRFFHGKLSSRNYIWIYLTIIIFIGSSLYSFISYQVFSHVSQNILLSTAKVSFQRSLNNTNSTLANLYYTSFNLAYDTQIQDDLSERAEHYVQTAFPVEFFQQNLRLYSVPVNLCILDTKSAPLFSTDYFSISKSALTQNFTRKAQWQPLFSGSQNILEMSFEIIKLNSMESLGYLVLRADELYINQAYDFFPNEQHQIYLHTPQGLILSSNNKSMIGSSLPEASQNTVVFSDRLSSVDLVLTIYYSTDALHTEMAIAVRSMIYFFLFFLLAVFISNIFISNYLSKQFRILGDTFADYSFDTQVDFFSKYSFVSEVNRTYIAFDKMQQRILSLMNDIVSGETQRYALELEKQHMEMQLLQSQINPHFLYNTFEAINSMIAAGDSLSGMQTLGALADMLRYSVKSTDMLVSFQKELHHAMLYMDIMALHSQHLGIHYDISPEALEVQTVRFILQPILENAIQHGLKNNGGVGNIDIIAKTANNKLIVVIRDDGVGMDAQTLRHLKASLAVQQSQTSIGLPNIANRLRLSHGPGGRLLIDSEEGMGCAVTIIQPISSDTDSEAKIIDKEKEI